MGLFDYFRSPLREVREERRQLEELRDSVNFTESIIAHQLAIAQGTYSPDAAKTAAAEFAAGLIGRCLAVADVEPLSAARLLTPLRRMDIGRKLVLKGNYVACIEIVRGSVDLQAARWYDVIRGGVAETSWLYSIELPAPIGIAVKRVLSPGVLHIRINPDSYFPWNGTSPLVSAGISADLLARVEGKSAEEMRSPVGHVLPLPAGMHGDNVKALQHDLGELNGRTALVETQAEGHGQGRFAAPHQDWQVKRLGPMIPESHVSLRSDTARDVCAALGIPPALYERSDGGSAREAYRQLLTSTLEPLAEIIKSEFRDKVGYPVELDFKRLAAADIAARARAYGTLVASGVDKEEAADVSGLAL